MTHIRIVIADDHAITRSGLEMILVAEDDIEIVGEAEDGQQAIELVKRLQPDVVVMDIQMPGMNGIEATRQIKAVSKDCAIVALTIHEDEQYFFQMLNAGALGYVPKRAAPDDLVRAIRLAAEGHVFLYSSMAVMLASDYLERMDNEVSSADESPLTPREREVITLLADGLSNQTIASELSISVKTVDRHRENIMNKLSLHSRTELVKYAIRKGYIDLE